MRPLSLAAASCFFLILLPVFFTQASEKDLSGGCSRITEKGIFKVDIALDGNKLVVGKNTAEVTVKDKEDKPLTGARLTVRAHVANHGESTFIKPSVTEKGSGLYYVENVYIDAEGNWELKITIRKDDSTDIAVFDFPGVKRRE